MRVERKLLQGFDAGLVVLVGAILVSSLVVLYSAGYNPDSNGVTILGMATPFKSFQMARQLLYILAGGVAITVMILVPPNFWIKGGYLWYALAVIALIVVDLFGTVVNGSRRWISFGGFALQPSELVKLATVMVMARFISAHPPGDGGYSLKELIMPGVLLLVPMGLIMRQPDLGTGLVVGGIGAAMILLAGVRKKVLGFGLVAAILAVIWGWGHLHEYQKNRILVLIDPSTDPRGTGYHIMQSKIAVGSGGFWGRGWLQGTQSHLEFLPEHTTDFIFSVLGEEWGFVGGVGVLTLYVLLLHRLFSIAGRMRDLSHQLVVVGVAAMIGIHAVINVGMVLGLFPVVGIPLPLFSYGGSSMLTILTSLGIVLSINMRRFWYG